VYEFFGCYYHGYTCQTVRDVITVSGDTLADKYERKMARIKQITLAGYGVKLQWDKSSRIEDTSRSTTYSAKYSRCSVWVSNRAISLYYMICEGKESMQYVVVMSLYPYVCKYFKFPVGHPVIHVGDAFQDKEAMLQKEGLIKYSILPLQRLYHPVLPFLCNGKFYSACVCRAPLSATWTENSVTRR